MKYGQVVAGSNAFIGAHSECVRRALATRPRVERSELVLGSLLTEVPGRWFKRWQ